jgi:ubiquitin carboxyl-terminal hydrolase 8
MFKQYENKGLSGLANLGNTCFINSTLQILSHTYEFNDFLNAEKYKPYLKKQNDTLLFIEWIELYKNLWKENAVVSPTRFISTLHKLAMIKGRHLFTGFSQNDMPEFLLFLIECFHNSLSREININILGNIITKQDKLAVKCYEMINKLYSKDYSEIWQMFYGIHVYKIKNSTTKKTLQTIPEPYFMIDLPIPPDNKSPTLIDCFNYYVEGEVLEGDNAWFNENTKQKETVNKSLQFWSFPPILVIDFKRFNARNQKNQILIDFPIERLDLSSYVIGYKKNSYIYELYGVSNHSGGVLGGHYTSYVKNANGKWYHYNDTNVSEVNLPQSIVSPKAYCLFYRKVQL